MMMNSTLNKTNNVITATVKLQLKATATADYLTLIRDTYPAETIFLIIIYTAMFIFGVVGNVLVITFFSKKLTRTLYDLYITQLAIADLIAVSVTPPRTILFKIFQNEGRYLNEAACKVLSAIEPISVNASAWILLSIAVERYRGIVRPLKRRYTRKNIMTKSCIIWLASCLLYLPYINAVTLKQQHCLPIWHTPYTAMAFNIAILMLQSVMPLGIMCYTIREITKAINRRYRFRGKSHQRQSKEIRLIRILKTCLGLFFICTIPYNVFYIALIIDVGVMKNEYKLAAYTTVNEWLALLVLVSTISNCFVYAGLYKDFKNYGLRCRRMMSQDYDSYRTQMIKMTSPRMRHTTIQITDRMLPNDCQSTV